MVRTRVTPNSPVRFGTAVLLWDRVDEECSWGHEVGTRLTGDGIEGIEETRTLGLYGCVTRYGSHGGTQA